MTTSNNHLGKRIMVMLLAVAIALSFMPGMAFAEDGDAPAPWNGSQATKPEIDASGTASVGTPAELAWIRNQVNVKNDESKAIRKIVLTADLDMNNKRWTPMGKRGYSEATKKEFAISIDGQGHTIKNLNPESTTYSGLIGYMEGSESNRLFLKDLTIQGDVSVGSKSDMAALVGATSYTDIKNIHNEARVHTGTKNSGANNVGGIAGLASNCTITNCVNDGYVGIDEGCTAIYHGGIAGSTVNTNITKCVNNGDVALSLTNTSTSGCDAGGIVGYYQVRDDEGYQITNCINHGNVQGRYAIGGIVGAVGTHGVSGVNATSESHAFTIKNVYNTGNVSGATGTTGGIVGLTARYTYKPVTEDYIEGSVISNVYSVGKVNENPDFPNATFGGLAGQSSTEEFAKAYALDSGVPMAYSWENQDGCKSLIASYYAMDENTVKAMDDEWFKSPAAVKALGSGFVMDYAGINGGYPILKIEAGSIDSYKEAAKAALESYKDINEYNTDGKNLIRNAKTAGGSAIDKAMTYADVDKAVSEAEATMDTAITSLQHAKDDAVEELKAYGEEDARREAEKAQVDALIEEAAEKIDAQETKSDVNAVVEEYCAKIDEVKTDLDLTKEEAKAELEGYMDAVGAEENSYEWSLMNRAVAEGKATIEKASGKKSVAKALAGAKEKIDEVKDSMDFDSAKADAEAAIDEAIEALAIEDPELAEELENIASEAKANINGAEDPAELAAVLAQALQDVGKVGEAAGQNALKAAKEAALKKIVDLEKENQKYLTGTDAVKKAIEAMSKINAATSQSEIDSAAAEAEKAISESVAAAKEKEKAAQKKAKLRVKKVQIKGKKTRTVKAGKKIKLKAKVTAPKGAVTKLKWKSSNKKYATVSQKGVVKIKKAGRGKKVRITAQATDGSGKKATVILKIKKR